MRKRNRILYLGLLLGAFSASAQETKLYKNTDEKYYHAVNLYNRELYAVAKVLFDEVSESENYTEIDANSAYYSASCAAKLGYDTAENRLLYFIENYPTSSKTLLALLDLGNYYFIKGDYAKSLYYTNKVNPAVLSPEQLNRLYFQKGYVLFQQKNYTASRTELMKVTENSTFRNQAEYYLGYISYERNDYDTANEHFNKIADIQKYKEKIGYFRADMFFKMGEFNKAIEEGSQQLSKNVNTETEESELSKIIGESYFNLQEYGNALPYILNYKGKDGKWSNIDFYQLGYIYYQQKDYQRAVSEFNKIISGSDEVAQNAYYHLGESYLKLNQKIQALNAFKNASELDFDTKITEGAFVNYAKLSYDIGNAYQSIPQIINNFLTKFPNSAYRSEMEDLLVDSYITTKNYKAALKLLEKETKTMNKSAYQKVTFYRGVEFFNEGNYNKALELFNKSIAQRQDLSYVSRATYWSAEAQYALGNYSEALSTLNTFSNLPQAEKAVEYNNIPYLKGYILLKDKKYNEAATQFENYLANGKSTIKKNDVELRLADAYFSNGNYSKAITLYNNAVQKGGNSLDYATFQKAILQGFNGKNEQKISELQSFISKHPSSIYNDDAMYELGATYANAKQSQKAIAAFDQLISKHPKSPFVSKALLRQGLMYYQDNDHYTAINKFKKVVTDYPNTQDAIQAINNIRSTYNDLGQTTEFAQWVKTVPFVDISTAELEQDAYEVADKHLAQENKNQAMSALKEYLKQYPNGSYAPKAHFNIAEIAYAQDKISEAKTNYSQVLSKGKSEYAEPSLVRLATISLQEKNNTEAINYLKQLEQVATNEKNILFAQSNLMKKYFEQKENVLATKYANDVIKNSQATKKVKADAYTILGRNAFESKDYNSAKAHFENLQKIGTGEAMAEALYYEAFFKTENKKYEESNATIQKLAKDYASYQYFGAKGLVLMAKNFHGLKDSFQAIYVLESVTENFKQYNDVITEANALLKQYKSEEAKRNSSVK